MRRINIPAVILTGCVVFNFFLCLVHTNLSLFSSSWIIGCEIILVGSAFVFSIREIDKYKIYWLCILAAQLLLFLFASAAKEEILAKSFRDILLMPVFVMLGLSSVKLNMTKFAIMLLSFTTIIALWETAFTQTFLQIFNFRDYFIAKGTLDEDFLLPLNTFASGVRPDGRFILDIPNLHRISSVFLEPVSLGFFSFIVGLYAISVSKYISRVSYIFVLAICFLLLWLSDARMAVGCLILSFVFKSIFIKMDHRFSFLIFPTALILSLLVEWGNVLTKAGEGLGARLHSTMILLSETNLEKMAGLEGYEYFTVDSALGELLHNFGILGFLLFWLPPLFFVRYVSPPARAYIFGISIYIACAFMLSSAIFTIKTAALLWFFYGYLIARGQFFEDRVQLARRPDSQFLTNSPISVSYPNIEGAHLGS